MKIVSFDQQCVVLIIYCFIVDVLDLAWSANDSWLASCSVDNCIVVWNADKFPGKDVQYFCLFIIYI